MPIDETATPGSADGVTPINDNQNNTSSVGAISDLGDILMDKSVENVEKNDFVPVSKNDVASLHSDDTSDQDGDIFPTATSTSADTSIGAVENHATIEDLQNIMLDTPDTNSPFEGTTSPNTEASSESAPIVEEVVTEPIVEPTQNDANALDINLGDISLAPETPSEQSAPESDTIINTTVPSEASAAIEEVVAEPIVEPTQNDANALDINLGDISLAPDVPAETPTEQSSPATTDTSNIEGSSEPVAIVEEVVAEPTIEPTEITGDTSIAQNDIPTNTTEENTSIDIDISSIQPVSTEESTTTVDTSIPGTEENIDQVVTVSDTPIVDNVVSNSADSQQVDATQEQTSSNNIASFLDNTPISTTETVANTATQVEAPATIDNTSLDKIANDITQGIDLDSLVADPITQATAQVSADSATTQTPAEGVKAMVSATTDKQKKLLLGLGVIALLGVVYFAVQTLSSPSIPTPPAPQAPTTTIPTVEEPTPEEVETTGSIAEEPSTGDVATTSGDTTETPIVEEEKPVVTTKTSAELISEAKVIDSNTRKALIKATVMKNMTARTEAFQLQKDIQTYIQTLENTNDITTLSDSETQLQTLSQRLDSILTSLNGSNQ